MTVPSDGGSSGPPSGDSPGAQDTTYHAKGHAWWPQGDPGKLRTAADAWDAAAAGIDRVAGDGGAAMRSVKSHNSGDAIDQIVAFWGRYSGGAADGGDGPALTEAAAACRQIAHACREYASGIERARHEIEALAAAAAATLVIGVALTIFTAGASDAAAVAAEEAIAAEAAALETTLAETIGSVVRAAVTGAIKGAVFSMGYDALIVQPIEIHFEPGRHFSIDEVGDWGLQGLAFGAAFEGLGSAVKAYRMARVLGTVPEEVRDLGTTGAGLSKWRQEFGEFLDKHPGGLTTSQRSRWTGRLGEAVARDAATGRGDTVLSEQVHVKVAVPTATGATKDITVIADFAVQDTKGDLYFLESKNGPRASLTENQGPGYPVLEGSGGVPYGPRAAQAGLEPGRPIGPTPVQVEWRDLDPEQVLAALQRLSRFSGHGPVEVTLPAALARQLSRLLLQQPIPNLAIRIAEPTGRR